MAPAAPSSSSPAGAPSPAAKPGMSEASPAAGDDPMVAGSPSEPPSEPGSEPMAEPPPASAEPEPRDLVTDLSDRLLTAPTENRAQTLQRIVVTP